MNRKGIIHRDLKPENILLNSKEKSNFDIRIADFGFSVLTNIADPDQSCEKGHACGTGGYIPPEALQGLGYSVKSDVFSVGSIMYSILSLRNLFFGKDQNDILRANKYCNIDHVIPNLSNRSREAQELLLKLLSADPKLRPTAAEALEHPWFANQMNAVIGSLTINALFSFELQGRKGSSQHMNMRKLGKKILSMSPDKAEPISFLAS